MTADEAPEPSMRSLLVKRFTRVGWQLFRVNGVSLLKRIADMLDEISLLIRVEGTGRPM
jgi:hypothetical protein